MSYVLCFIVLCFMFDITVFFYKQYGLPIGPPLHGVILCLFTKFLEFGSFKFLKFVVFYVLCFMFYCLVFYVLFCYMFL